MAQSKFSVFTSRIANADQESFGNIQMAKAREDVRATYCSSQFCSGVQGGNARGKIVWVGQYLSKCPECGYTALYHDTVTKAQAEKFKESQRVVRRKKR